MTQHLSQRKHAFIATALAGASVFALPMLGGCSDPPPPPPVVQAPPPPPPPPPAPTATPVSELMSRLDIDRRVSMPEEFAPATDGERVAVLKFYDAFVRGRADALRPMLSGPDQLQLDGLVEAEVFGKTIDGVTRIDVRCGKAEGENCTLAVFHAGESFQPQLWVYSVNGEEGEFDSVATPPKIMEKLSGDDWIAAWMKEVKLELAKATEPDEVIEIPQTDFTEESSNTGPDGQPAAAPAGGGDGKPGGAPGRRLPNGPKVAPPRAPGFGTK